MWKIHAFLETRADMADDDAITNLIVVGDSMFEIEAGKILGAQFKNAFIKTIKFCKSPNITQLLKQIKMFVTKFVQIYSEKRHLSVNVNKERNSLRYSKKGGNNLLARSNQSQSPIKSAKLNRLSRSEIESPRSNN